VRAWILRVVFLVVVISLIFAAQSFFDAGARENGFIETIGVVILAVMTLVAAFGTWSKWRIGETDQGRVSLLLFITMVAFAGTLREVSWGGVSGLPESTVSKIEMISIVIFSIGMGTSVIHTFWGLNLIKIRGIWRDLTGDGSGHLWFGVLLMAIAALFENHVFPVSSVELYEEILEDLVYASVFLWLLRLVRT